MKIQAKRKVTYYKPCDANTLGSCINNIYTDGTWFCLVTETTTDKYLIDAARLAPLVGGMPWRDGNGITPDTRYGIKLPN